TSAGEVLGEVKDETGTGAALNYDSGVGKLISARTVARSTGALRFHTDKCDLLSLLCLSNGIEGGVSKIVSSVAIHNAMARRRPDLLTCCACFMNHSGACGRRTRRAIAPIACSRCRCSRAPRMAALPVSIP